MRSEHTVTRSSLTSGPLVDEAFLLTPRKSATRNDHKLLTRASELLSFQDLDGYDFAGIRLATHRLPLERKISRSQFSIREAYEVEQHFSLLRSSDHSKGVRHSSSLLKATKW